MTDAEARRDLVTALEAHLEPAGLRVARIETVTLVTVETDDGQEIRAVINPADPDAFQTVLARLRRGYAVLRRLRQGLGDAGGAAG